jgi:hypothetical protein
MSVYLQSLRHTTLNDFNLLRTTDLPMLLLLSLLSVLFRYKGNSEISSRDNFCQLLEHKHLLLQYSNSNSILNNYIVKTFTKTVKRPRRPRGGVEVQLYSLFNLRARRGRWSTPRPGRFTPGKETQQSNPITDLDRPRGFQELETSRFQDNRHIKVLRLSALRTGRLYPQRNIPGTHFC